MFYSNKKKMIGQHGQLIIDSVGHKPCLLGKWPMDDRYIVFCQGF